MTYLFELVKNNFLLFLLVIAIICFQYFYFYRRTKKRIGELRRFFPDLSKAEVILAVFYPGKMQKKTDLDHFVEAPDLVSDATDPNEDYDVVSLVKVPCSIKEYEAFEKVVHKTNVYLCKNSGASADFSLLKDICDRQIEICEGEIHNSLNAPLYLGLAGTFLGIITGLWGVDLSAVVGGSANALAPFQHLLGGVVVAMLASLAGLVFTILNSQLHYKEAAKKVDSDKDEYFDFLQRELMPTLSTTMASSLNALRSVLGHFVDNFGKNLDSYTGSISLLNDNIKEQHEVLVEINKLNLSKTAAKIAETFNTMQSASDALDVFKGYQQELNTAMSQAGAGLKKSVEDAGTNLAKTMEDAGSDLSKTMEKAGETMKTTVSGATSGLKDSITDAVSGLTKTYEDASKHLSDTVSQVDLSVGRLENVIKAFDDFGQGLQLIVQSQTKSTELLTQFQKAIETHFPIGSAGREIWQKEFEQLQKDSSETTKQLQQELMESTKHIKNFVDNNKEFFSTFDQLKQTMSEMSSYAKVQVDCYNSLKTEIEALRKDNKDKQMETAGLHKALLDAIKTMTVVLNTKKES